MEGNRMKKTVLIFSGAILIALSSAVCASAQISEKDAPAAGPVGEVSRGKTIRPKGEGHSLVGAKVGD